MHVSTSPVPWTWRDAGLVVGAAVLITVVLTLLARSAVTIFELGEQRSMVSPVLYAIIIGFYLSLIGATAVLIARRSGWAALGFTKTSPLNYALVPIFYLVALVSVAAITTLLTALTGGFENPQIDALTGGQVLAPGELVLLFVLAAVIVPIAEELLYRGILYPLLRQRFGMGLALVFNAALFAITHFILILIPALFVIGFLLAYLRERSGSLGPSIALHALQNGLVVVSLNALVRGS